MDTRFKKVYLVGGAVRDALLGVDCADYDYVVVGENIDALLKLGFQAIGSDFPVFLHPKTKDEYALARTERKSGSGYTGFTVDASSSVTLEEDLSRRDLTINAMARDGQGQIIDPFNGQQDLQDKVLRHTTLAFTEDPVRVLRVARFLARLGDQWTIHPQTYQLMQQLRDNGELKHLVAERVWKETEKALGEKYPHLYFEALKGLGIFPEVEVMVNIPQPVAHHPEGDVYNHTMLVLKQAADKNFDLETRFAALTHDFGKPICHQKRGKLHGHEQAGLPIIDTFCERIKVPNRFKTIALLTSDNHTLCHTIFQLTSKTLHKLLIDKLNAVAQPERFRQFLQTCICDAQGRGPDYVDKPYPQADFAQALVTALANMDKKFVVQEAIKQGKKGPDIGSAVRIAELSCISQFLSANKVYIDTLKR
jgi:tRNA nucleotidyltransferase (CCA-adding enzyme)